jgi:hypothetical protein
MTSLSDQLSLPMNRTRFSFERFSLTPALSRDPESFRGREGELSPDGVVRRMITKVQGFNARIVFGEILKGFQFAAAPIVEVVAYFPGLRAKVPTLTISLLLVLLQLGNQFCEWGVRRVDLCRRFRDHERVGVSLFILQ